MKKLFLKLYAFSLTLALTLGITASYYAEASSYANPSTPMASSDWRATADTSKDRASSSSTLCPTSIPGSHAAGSDTLSGGMFRQFAQQAFFEQLAVIRKEHPEITDPRKLIKRALMKSADSDAMVNVGYFGLSIQDIIEHKLVPEVNCFFGTIEMLNLSNMYIDDLSGIKNIKRLKN